MTIRLTLRTLLAYLDDVLEPSEAVEIGNKIAESPVADELAKRIREVVRRRRLGAPEFEPNGTAIDPNYVANYLDNTMPAEELAAFEKLCLESDLELAEVAAVHQILTTAVSEPVPAGNLNMARFNALGQPKASKPGSQPSLPTVPAKPSTFAEGLPDQLKPRSLVRQVLPFAVLGVLTAIWIGTLVVDSQLVSGIKQSTVPQRSAAKSSRVTVVSSSDSAKPADTNPAAALLSPAAENQASNSALATPTQSPDATAASSLPMEVASAKTNQAPVDPAAEALPEAMPPKTSTEVAAAASPAPAALIKPAELPQPTATSPNPPAPPAVTERYSDGVQVLCKGAESVAMRFDANDRHWYLMERDKPLPVLQVFAVPEPFEAQVLIEPQLAQVAVLGGTVVQTLPSERTTAAGLLVDRGRIVVDLPAPKAEQASFGLAVGGLAYRIKAIEGPASFAVEVRLKEPEAVDQHFGRSGIVAFLVVTEGQVLLQEGTQEPIQINTSQRLSLSPGDRQAAIAVESPADSVTSFIPDWVSLDRRKMSPTMRRTATAFEKLFEPETKLEMSMAALANDPRPKVAELAVEAAVLTGNLEGMVLAFDLSPHEEARLAAIHGLRQWLPREPQSGKRLMEELLNRYSPEEAQEIHRLLWGYSEGDSRDPETSRALVQALMHPDEEIRELAFLHIQRLAGRKYDYRPTDPVAKRGLTVQRWVNHLEREGALNRPMP